MNNDDRPIMKRDPEGYDHYEHYYYHSYFCGNCSHNTYRYILKGVRVKDLTLDCDNCGCPLNTP